MSDQLTLSQPQIFSTTLLLTLLILNPPSIRSSNSFFYLNFDMIFWLIIILQLRSFLASQARSFVVVCLYVILSKSSFYYNLLAFLGYLLPQYISTINCLEFLFDYFETNFNQISGEDRFRFHITFTTWRIQWSFQWRKGPPIQRWTFKRGSLRVRYCFYVALNRDLGIHRYKMLQIEVGSRISFYDIQYSGHVSILEALL